MDDYMTKNKVNYMGTMNENELHLICRRENKKKKRRKKKRDFESVFDLSNGNRYKENEKY